MRMLIIGRADPRSGFGRVACTLQRELAGLGVEVDLLDSQTKVERTMAGSSQTELRHWPGGNLDDRLKQLDPEAVLFTGDAWAYPLTRRLLRSALPRASIVAYYVFEYAFESAFLGEALADLDHVVTPTRWARDLVRRQPGFDRTTPVSVIPHGVDRQRFFPLCPRAGRASLRSRDRGALRRKLFPDRPEIRDSYLVLNGNQNVRRKRLDLTLRGFRRFSRGIDWDSRLVLLSDPAGRTVDLRPLIRKLGLANRVVRPDLGGPSGKMSDAVLNELYNACDVGLNTAMGEGWGLVSLEHAATGAAQVVSDLPSLAEIWGDNAPRIPSQPRPMGGSCRQTFRVVTAGAVARHLEEVYRGQTRWSSRAFEHARSREFCWSRIAERWLEVVMRTIRARRAA